jgi:hypothetical protein
MNWRRVALAIGVVAVASAAGVHAQGSPPPNPCSEHGGVSYEDSWSDCTSDLCGGPKSGLTEREYWRAWGCGDGMVIIEFVRAECNCTPGQP